ATLRGSDVVSRMDAGRIVAALPSASLNDALRVAESVRRAIREAGLTTPTSAPLSASIGISAYPDHAQEAGPLLAAASEALARARARGPGCIAAAPLAVKRVSASIVRSVG